MHRTAATALSVLCAGFSGALASRAGTSVDLITAVLNDAHIAFNASTPVSLLERVGEATRLRGRSICGGTSIGTMLGLETHMKPESYFDNMRTIPWTSIMAEADKYIAEENSKLGDLQAKLMQAASMLPAAKPEGVEGKSMLETGLLESIISVALGKGFGSVDVASSSGCGVRGAINGYQAAEDAFQCESAKQMQGKLWIGRHEVEKACRTMVQDDAQRISLNADSVCSDLCQSFGAIAEASSRIPEAGFLDGTTKSLTQISDQIEDLHTELKTRQQAVKQCAEDRRKLMDFGKQMHTFEQELESQRKREREAIVKLRKLDQSMTETSKSISEQKEKLMQIMALLAASDSETSTLRSQIADSKNKEDELDNQAKGVQLEIRGLQQGVKSTGEAVRAINEFKKSLEIAMHDVLQVFEKSIRQPLQNMGLLDILKKLDMSVWSKVPDGMSKTKELLLSGSASVDRACEDVAEKTALMSPALAGVAEGSMRDVCDNQKADRAKDIDDIVAIVGSERAEVAGILQKLRCDIGDFQCATETPTDAEAAVGRGAPAYLENVRAIYGDSLFYTEYAKEWSAGSEAGEGRGSLLKLKGAMEELYTEMLEKEKSARASFASLLNLYTQADQERQRLGEKLQEALEKQRMEAQQKTEADRILAEFLANKKQLQGMKDVFARSSQEAMDAYADAKQKLISEFSAHSFASKVEDANSEDASEGGDLSSMAALIDTKDLGIDAPASKALQNLTAMLGA